MFSRASSHCPRLQLYLEVRFDVAPFVHRRCKSPIEEIQAAVDGSFSPWQAEKLKIIQEHMKDIEHCKKLLEDLIFRLAQPYKRQIDLIMTVPGICDRMTAIRIICQTTLIFPREVLAFAKAILSTPS